ncbi:hypothetical protein NMY22_g12189 [Coprinellus aureogranulatus]|nr:hypothetical protein NMY22_g12189 [Coprinellus aureogranulatus]
MRIVVLQDLQYQIGCGLIHTLDLVQDFVTLSKQKENIFGHIISMNEGFPEDCLAKFMEYVQEARRIKGSPSTGIVETGSSTANYSADDLTVLGIDFSTKPSALGLDGIVADIWRRPLLPMNIPPH